MGPAASFFVKIVTRKNQEIGVEYRVRKENDVWLVYDVLIEGVSMVRNYRAQFSQILSKSPFEELLERLEAKLGEPFPVTLSEKRMGSRSALNMDHPHGSCGWFTGLPAMGRSVGCTSIRKRFPIHLPCRKKGRDSFFSGLRTGAGDGSFNPSWSIPDFSRICIWNGWDGGPSWLTRKSVR